ncbi:MAG TPA: hypothetical protein VEG29_08360 [Candidatus Binatia bacterium]|nr:hypothetical protein [Candidatus Binatia bacterium]
MKYLAGTTSRTTDEADAIGGWSFDSSAAPVSTIEELGEPATVAVARGRWDRIVGVLVAVCAAVVCFGFAGRIWIPTAADVHAVDPLASQRAQAVDSPAPTAQAGPVTLSEPADGARSAGGVIHVQGQATPDVKSVHVSVALGSAVLGFSDLDVGTDGTMQGDVHLFEPSFDVAVTVLATGATGDGARFEVRRTVDVAAGAPVTIWHEAISGGSSGDAPVLLVDGSARASIPSVTVEVLTSSGRRLAGAVAPNGRDDYRPGSFGGELVGRSSFRARIAIPSSALAGGIVVRLSWRDDATGATGRLSSIVTSPGPGVR